MNESNTNLNDGATNNFTNNAINNVNNVSLQTAKATASDLNDLLLWISELNFHGYMLMIFEKIIEFENF